MTDYSPADPFAPLIDLLTKIRSSGREVNIHPELHLPPTENSGWLTAAQLADPAQPWLGEMVERTAVNLGTTRQIAASLAWKRYSYWVIFLVVIGWTLNRRVPLLDAQHLCVRFSQQAEYPEVAVVDGVAAVLPDDSLAGPSSIVVVESPAALLSLARQHLIERHLAAVAAALHRLTGVSERLLWCTVAAAMVQPLLLIQSFLPNHPVAEAPALLKGIGSEFIDLVELHITDKGSRAETLELRRKTCCLARKVPGINPCSACPLSNVRSAGVT